MLKRICGNCEHYEPCLFNEEYGICLSDCSVTINRYSIYWVAADDEICNFAIPINGDQFEFELPLYDCYKDLYDSEEEYLYWKERR